MTVAQLSGVSTGTNAIPARAAARLARAARRRAAALWTRDGEPPQGVSSAEAVSATARAFGDAATTHALATKVGGAPTSS